MLLASSSVLTGAKDYLDVRHGLCRQDGSQDCLCPFFASLCCALRERADAGQFVGGNALHWGHLLPDTYKLRCLKLQLQCPVPFILPTL